MDASKLTRQTQKGHLLSPSAWAQSHLQVYRLEADVLIQKGMIGVLNTLPREKCWRL